MAASLFLKVKSPQIILNLTHTCKFLPKSLRNQRHVRFSSSNILENDTSIENTEEELVNEVNNFSNLPPLLYDKYYGVVPKQSYLEEKVFPDYRKRNEFLKELFATYGKESGVDPGICWPSKEELKTLREDEKDWELTFQEMVADLKKQKDEEEEYRQKLQEKVEKNMANMDKLIQAFKDKKMKEIQKEEERMKQEKIMLDEAEEHYGYPVNVHSEEFKLFKKEKKDAERKALKELKRKQKKSLLSAKLQAVG